MELVCLQSIPYFSAVWHVNGGVVEIWLFFVNLSIIKSDPFFIKI